MVYSSDNYSIEAGNRLLRKKRKVNEWIARRGALVDVRG